MDRQPVVFPEIARLPGERLLEGVPHNKGESVFAIPGMADACNVATQTQDLNSRNRRPVVDNFLKQMEGWTPERKQELIESLGSIANDGLTDSPSLALRASYLQKVFTEKINRAQEAISSAQREIEPQNPYSMRLDYDWATGLRKTDIGKSDRRSEFYKDKVLAQKVGYLVRLDDQTNTKAIEAGAGLFNRFNLEESGVHENMTTFLNLATAIDKAKVKAIGFNGSTKISNLIIQAAGATMVSKIPPDQLKYACGLVEDELDRRVASTNPSEGWMIPKWILVKQNILFRSLSKGVANSTRELKTLHRGAEPLDFTEINKQITDTMDNFGRLRKYGIKPSYINDGKTNREDQVWVFSDPGAESDLIGHQIYTNFLAETTLSPKDGLEKILNPEITKTEYGEGISSGMIGAQTYMRLAILPDGELIISSSLGVLPLRDEFKSYGMEDEYDYLRVGLLTNLFDMVIPKDISYKELETVFDSTEYRQRTGKTIKHTDILDLIIPRMRIINERTDEVEKTIIGEIENSRRKLREHDVVWHIRKLRPGQLPTKEAIDRAISKGVELEQGETFVKSHIRGNPDLGRIEGHRAVKR